MSAMQDWHDNPPLCLDGLDLMPPERPGGRAFRKAVDMLENPPLVGTPIQVLNHTLRALTYGVLAIYEVSTGADE